MQLRTSERKSAKIRLSLQGASNSGKSMSSLLLAFGLVGDWKKIAVIDTENGSADLYSELGTYYVLTLTEPYSPERYIEAIKLCEANGIECIIIDSISHEWNGKGGCLEIHEQVTAAMRIPNSFTAWASVTPKHQAFIDAILQCNCHVITTIRSKTEYVISERNGKNSVIKLGMAPVTRDGFEYEVTISLDLDEEHYASCSKDRTNLFSGKPKFKVTIETGKLIRAWCNSGVTVDYVRQLINSTVNIDELNKLFQKYSSMNQQLNTDFSRRKQELLSTNAVLTQQNQRNGNGNEVTNGPSGK
jgi:hypothetical protein